MGVASKWIAVGAGAIAGGSLGVVLGTTVFGDDEPRTNIITVTLPTTTTTTTVAPTTTVVDEPLAEAPSDTVAPGPTFPECDTFVDSGPDLPVELCDRSDTVRLVQNLLSANGFDVIPDGKFGSSTAEAVVAFQRSVELAPDGVVDAFTFRALCDNSAVDICVTG
jgi:peptidoglycan hydrolase-like protein with peptidoglycan-binding domain